MIEVEALAVGSKGPADVDEVEAARLTTNHGDITRHRAAFHEFDVAANHDELPIDLAGHGQRAFICNHVYRDGLGRLDPGAAIDASRVRAVYDDAQPALNLA